MENSSGAKIWKYQDLAKFTSLLATQSLYFACPAQFDDPYEGLPRSHIDAESKIIQVQVDQLLSLREQFTARAVPIERFDEAIATFASRVRTARKEAALKFGVSCWHESEYESEAMWKLYSTSGQGVAIESTIEQLRSSLGNREGLQIDRVRYMDFDQDPIEKGHRHYGLFIKRRCFEHEKEVRATFLLPEAGKGIPIGCDLDVLVTAVHVSPLVEGFVKAAIEALCVGNTYRLNRPVHQSPLFSAPDYQIDIETK